MDWTLILIAFITGSVTGVPATIAAIAAFLASRKNQIGIDETVKSSAENTVAIAEIHKIANSRLTNLIEELSASKITQGNLTGELKEVKSNLIAMQGILSALKAPPIAQADELVSLKDALRDMQATLAKRR